MKDPKIKPKTGANLHDRTILRAGDEGINLGEVGDQWKLDWAEFQIVPPKMEGFSLNFDVTSNFRPEPQWKERLP